eukprot:894644-Prorocentrum_minimum.AAC.2
MASVTRIHADHLLKSVAFACLSIAIKLEEVVTITPDELQARRVIVHCAMHRAAGHIAIPPCRGRVFV